MFLFFVFFSGGGPYAIFFSYWFGVQRFTSSWLSIVVYDVVWQVVDTWCLLKCLTEVQALKACNERRKKDKVKWRVCYYEALPFLKKLPHWSFHWRIAILNYFFGIHSGILNLIYYVFVSLEKQWPFTNASEVEFWFFFFFQIIYFWFMCTSMRWLQ